MAVILPDAPLVTTSAAVAKFHRLFKYLPDDAYTVWHRLTIHPGPGPDFWVLGHDRRSLWLKVSALTLADSKLFVQAGLFTSSVARPAEAEHQALLHFARQCFAEEAESPFQTVPTVVVFPNLAEAELARLVEFAELPAGVQWASKDRKSTRLNSSHIQKSRMPSSA